MQKYFMQLAEFISEELESSYFYKANFYHEASHFVRFNEGKVRQAGSVEQADINITLIEQQRSSTASVRLSLNWKHDTQLLANTMNTIKESLSIVPEDPHLLFNTEKCDSDNSAQNQPDVDAITTTILDTINTLDFVGILAIGSMSYGFANSTGQRNWHASSNFNLDWSIYLGKSGETKDKAVKCSYAGRNWDNAIFLNKIEQAKQHLERLKTPPVNIEPGEYRAYFSPSALSEIIGLLNWGGYSERSMQTKQSPLFLLSKSKQLNPSVTITEDIKQGTSPAFQSDGYIRPDRLELISKGKLGNMLCSPRTAKEYGLTHNSAPTGEAASSLSLAPGTLPENDVLTALGTGLYINNLWYLNYSDRTSGRITGMTRFACFWVEDGQIKAPINVVRIDDTIFSLLGESLENLTVEREHILDSGSYEQRANKSQLLPGLLVSALKVTL